MKFAILNLCGAFLIAALFVKGWGAIPFQADSTGLTYLIAAVFLMALVLAAAGRWEAVRWMGGVLVFLGLIGTVIGFIMALSGVDPGQAGDVNAIQPMVSALLRGMATALHTTLLGSLGYLWLSVNAYLIAREEI